MKTVILLCTLALFAAGCESIGQGLGTAQAAMSPYGFYFVGTVTGAVGANSAYCALDAQVTATIRAHNRGETIWEETFEKAAGQRAFQLVFDEDGTPRIIKATWEQARSQMPWLPATKPVALAPAK